MSSITSGVGLVSGLPIKDLVDSLIAVQARPITQLQSRLGVFSGRRTGLLQISAQLLSIKTAITRFGQASFFNTSTANSSNSDTLAVSAGSNATIGDYSLLVRNLATKHQLVSRGFATADQSAVGAGTITIESAAGQVNRATRLSELNGGSGVQVGKIRITDRTGASATVDLVGALTITDVVDRINGANGVGVTARIDGDRLIVEDQTGGAGTLSVGEVGAGRTAADLGLLQSSASNSLIGQRIVYLDDSTRLGTLNDGNGIRRRNLANDLSFTLRDGSSLGFNLSDAIQQNTPLSLLNSAAGVPSGKIKITNRAGASAEVDLNGAVTVQDVIDRVSAAGIQVALTVSGSRLTLLDTSITGGQTAQSSLKVEDVDSTTAQALGIASTGLSDRIQGNRIYFVETVGDVLRIINSSPQNLDAVTGAPRISAAIAADGRGIVINDLTNGSGSFVVGESNVARDLGLGSTPSGMNGPPVSSLSSGALVAGLNTVLLRSLNGGAGVNLTDLRIGDRSGGPLVSVNLSGATTLSDVIDAINAAGTGVRAAVAASGLGIELTDTSGGSSNLRIQGATADSLGIATDAAVSARKGANLQRQYVSEATRRSDFNLGAGIPSGRFRITDSNGASAVVDLTGDERTIGEIISEINSRGIGVLARINDSGDGLLLTDTAGGAGRLRVAEDGGTVAKSLGILGQAAEGEAFIDGSLERRIVVSGSDSLNNVLAKIQSSGAAVNASIINDGSGGAAYRLNLVGTRTGFNGALAIDTGTTGLLFDELSRARDAVVILGEAGADRPLVLSSGSNTLEGVIAGVKIDLVAASETPVQVTVRRDLDAIVSQAKTLVNAFNTVIGTLDNLTRFDPETFARGVLQGDSTARRVRQTLTALANTPVNGASGGLNRLSSVGIKLGSNSKLELDEARLRAALESDPEGVKNLFAAEESSADGVKTVIGLAGVIQREINRLTDVDNGLITLQEESLQTSESQLQNRISSLTKLLASRRERLMAQFQNMETVIANLQSQQNSIAALSSLIPSS
ncbi:MAG: flagellar filament capping protein FliD [Phycisphaerae bacterium]|nr:flagellar filament capping protein FliD [Phycisphaerae bacterium]